MMMSILLVVELYGSLCKLYLQYKNPVMILNLFLKKRNVFPITIQTNI